MRALTLIAVLLACTGQATACTWDPSFVSPSAKALSPDQFRGIGKAMSVHSIISQLGPAARDVGSGLYVLQWDVTDGRVFFV